MTNHLRLTLGTIFLTTILYGQEITKEEIVKFKIKSIMTIDGDDHVKSIDYYNTTGDLIKIGEKDEDEIRIRRQFLYKNQLLTEERALDYRGDILHTTKYYYNPKSQLTKKENIASDNSVNGTWTYEYDESGNKIKETQISGTMGNSVTIFKYLGKQLIEEEKTTESIGKEEKITYKYNDKGLLIEKKTKAFYFNTTITLTYAYNASDKLVQLDEKSSNGVSSKTTYQYNDKGLLVSDIWKSSLGKTSNKTRYIVEF
jgi:YD repeat-containing protein